ncbi:unnamed protein product [Orchesella dallaii]|uniref:Peptidase S1 domain-containing protein n=1 Tax=Orchesella dallaii TaxID=48710 RepID=A0ABP1Q2G9_9HEXA
MAAKKMWYESVNLVVLGSILLCELLTTATGQTTSCRCTPVTNCADGTGGIDPRILNNPTQPVCAVGERLCCNLINPNLGVSVPVLCGTRRAITVPNYVAVTGQADFGEYPWLALIYSSNNTYIGAGTLIDTQFVLSVAHKFVPALYSSYKVVLGEWILNAVSEPLPLLEIAVTSIRVHEGFIYTPATATLLNDIAILKLATPVNVGLSNHINPACLPIPNAIYTGQTCWVAGFGASAFVNGAMSTTLREVDLPVVDGNTCQNLLRTTRLGSAFTLNQQQFICAGGQAGKDACTGDGGAPLVCLSGTQWYVAALVAYGVGCGQPIPAVYTNVANYIPWISANKI